MDFLMIISEHERVVIEIDGVQHYADYVKGNTKHYASVDRYAEMVAAQREMTLAGYDVYRFGGKELHNQCMFHKTTLLVVKPKNLPVYLLVPFPCLIQIISHHTNLLVRSTKSQISKQAYHTQDIYPDC